jgi:hypothetical protein
MVGEIAKAVRDSFDDTADDGAPGIGGDEIDDTFAERLGAISNKVDDPEDPVDPDVDTAVRDLVDGKVSEPAP